MEPLGKLAKMKSELTLFIKRNSASKKNRKLTVRTDEPKDSS